MRQKTNRLIPRAAMTLLLSVLTTVTAWAYGIATTGSCGTNASYAIITKIYALDCPEVLGEVM